MLRYSSRPKYLAASTGIGRSGVEDEHSEASRPRRVGEMPKRLSPLDAPPATGRFSFRMPWPELDIQTKDADAYQEWCFRVETTLSQAFQDARCPYKFLDPRVHGSGSEDAQRDMSAPWLFRDFLNECDYPDEEGFDSWFEAMQERQSARVRAQAAGRQN
eukprot:gnl/TRDRNA2_/TRDRNA2_190127_c0_seq1.p1 gnl/TRDRNA2_/TRDRNA2_190127_c0~~gnl/TRDRNA2_/TRDRNA2_190127_c0_seq1.p1  ORF type:complete len:160 (+),score=22.84 gnl/TRDRNA2_/TRDRNA2_190127_c0_seq1:130-609(+)